MKIDHIFSQLLLYFEQYYYTSFQLYGHNARLDFELDELQTHFFLIDLHSNIMDTKHRHLKKFEDKVN